MDTWISRCNRTVECVHCHREIELHEPCVFGKQWVKTQSGSWLYYMYHWHAKRKDDGVCCWVEQGLFNFSQMKFVETRGRKVTLTLSAEIRQKRLAILQRHARLVQMLKEEMEKLATDSETAHPVGSWERVAHYGQELEALKEKIAPLGGVPPSWIIEESTGQETPAQTLQPMPTGS